MLAGDGIENILGNYAELLKAYDEAVCESVAVGQKISGRMVEPHLGFATHIFTRICGHAVSLIRAVPKSRWVRSDFEHWDFSSVAGHSRSILEGILLFNYVIAEPESPDAWSAKINVMHLNDCNRRLRLFKSSEDNLQLEFFSVQAEELKERLNGNSWFISLDLKLQKELLLGKHLTILNRDELLNLAGWDKLDYDVLWDVLSQYTHVLPFSFYGVEENGKGTGMENATDKGYISLMLYLCGESLKSATDNLVLAFPDAATVRKGAKSKFSLGPQSNRPLENNKKTRKKK
jgi:hypothetical protein